MDEQITKIFKDLGPFNAQLDQTIKKIAELNSGILKNSKAFDVDFKGAISGAIKTFDTFYTSGEGVGKSLKASFKDFNATVDKSRDSLKEVSKGLSNTEKVSVGIGGAIEIFTSFKDVLYDLVSGNKDAGEAFVALIPVLASVGVAMYAALGPVGLIIGALAAIGGAIFGLAQAAEEAAIEVLFDNVGISAETLSATLDTVGGSVIEQNEKFNKFAEDLAELGNQYSELRETFEIESLLISDSTTATEDSFKKFDETRLAMAENVKQQLTDTTDMAMKAYREMVTQNGQEMTEEQKSVLLKMQENKTAKMAEIDAINTEINKITQNGINTRGHLIDEEKRKIDELYKKQEELANFSAKLEQRKQSQMLNDIKSGKIQLNIGNYEQYLKSIPEQATKAQQAALDNYMNQLALYDATLNTPKTQIQYKDSVSMAKTAYEKALSQINTDQNNLIAVSYTHLYAFTKCDKCGEDITFPPVSFRLAK